MKRKIILLTFILTLLFSVTAFADPIINNSIGNKILSAKWSPKTYTVTFNANGGNTPSQATKSVTYDSTYGDLATCSRTGYTFAGWFTASTGGTQITASTKVAITTNQTLYAHWTPINYTVTFNANGGNTPSQATKTITYDSTYGTLATCTRTGYNFSGWFTDPTGGTQITDSTKVTITTNQTLYAHWTPINYTITYNLNGGTNNKNNKSNYNIETARFSIYSPTKTGYTFTGWTGSNGTTPQTSVSIAKGSTGDKSYTANWSPTNYTISYSLNGGTATNNTSYNLQTNSFTLNNPTRANCTFIGWGGTGLTGNTNKSVTIQKGSTGSRTYIANWKTSTSNITLPSWMNNYSSYANLSNIKTFIANNYGTSLYVGFLSDGNGKFYVQSASSSIDLTVNNATLIYSGPKASGSNTTNYQHAARIGNICNYILSQTKGSGWGTTSAAFPMTNVSYGSGSYIYTILSDDVVTKGFANAGGGGSGNYDYYKCDTNSSYFGGRYGVNSDVSSYVYTKTDSYP